MRFPISLLLIAAMFVSQFAHADKANCKKSWGQFSLFSFLGAIGVAGTSGGLYFRWRIKAAERRHAIEAFAKNVRNDNVPAIRVALKYNALIEIGEEP